MLLHLVIPLGMAIQMTRRGAMISKKKKTNPLKSIAEDFPKPWLIQDVENLLVFKFVFQPWFDIFFEFVGETLEGGRRERLLCKHFIDLKAISINGEVLGLDILIKYFSDHVDLLLIISRMKCFLGESRRSNDLVHFSRRVQKKIIEDI